MQNNISRTETDILKGVAIIMMLWLHLFLKESDIGTIPICILQMGCLCLII